MGAAAAAFSTGLASADDKWTISVGGYFTQALVQDIGQKIGDLRTEDPTRKITLEFYDIEGGEIEAGFDLAGTLYEAKNIDLVCRGKLESMGANVFVSYQGGERIAGKDCNEFMLHDLIVKLWAMNGYAPLVRTYAEKLSQNLHEAVEIIARGTSEAADMPLESARALFGADCYLNPDKAYQLGLIDRFEDSAKELPTRLPDPQPEDVYRICGTQPLANAEIMKMPDWNKKNFGLRTQLSATP